jgi:hypothetical protein
LHSKITNKIEISGKHIDEDFFQKSWSLWHFGATFGFFGGIVAILTGLVMTFAIWISQHNSWHISFQKLTNTLFYCSFPMLFIGAYCLDKIDEAIKQKSRQNQSK